MNEPIIDVIQPTKQQNRATTQFLCNSDVTVGWQGQSYSPYVS